MESRDFGQNGWISDEGQHLRRAGLGLMWIGIAPIALGLYTLTMAYRTYSGYIPQAALACMVGAVTIGIGWIVLRRGDALGPRFVPIYTHASPPAWPTTAEPARVRVQTRPLGHLPRGR